MGQYEITDGKVRTFSNAGRLGLRVNLTATPSSIDMAAFVGEVVDVFVTDDAWFCDAEVTDLTMIVSGVEATAVEGVAIPLTSQRGLACYSVDPNRPFFRMRAAGASATVIISTSSTPRP